jgi:hypothetical protein
MLMVLIRVPDRHDRQHIPSRPKHQVEQVKKKVPLVLKSKTVVDPRTVVVRLEDTLVAHRAVMRTLWLDFFADVAVPVPELSQVFHCL